MEKGKGLGLNVDKAQTTSRLAAAISPKGSPRLGALKKKTKSRTLLESTSAKFALSEGEVQSR